ncbi:MAG: hypothetical protein J6X92_02770 [Bacteroidales bacterium]|nr:hypothetical protein [Bacteroidales bacterium]
MSRTLCYSVRLESLVRISDKAFKATAFDGSCDIIPASQVFGIDYEAQKSDAWWIAAWLLEKKDLQYSNKKKAWFDESGKRLPDYLIVHHKPEKKEVVDSNEINCLKK